MKRLIFFLACTPMVSFAQFEVVNGGDPQQLVSEFLLGNGVLVSNVEYTGSLDQLGVFHYATALGLDSGLVLSTGCPSNLEMGSSGFCMPFFEGNSPGGEDLLAVANSVPELIGEMFDVFGVYDVAQLEFDFVPFGSDIQFDYIFTSNEYLTFINSSFNDVFAFFVSGPGINGTFSNNAVNVAIVPNSSPELPITVSSVNPSNNSEYYVDNAGYATFPMQTNGYTTLLTAQLSNLQVGETYHIRLTIADGSDSALDSNVLLKAGSFTSSVEVTPGGPGDLNGDGFANISDLLILIAEFGCESSCSSDINDDGITNVLDILEFLQLFE